MTVRSPLFFAATVLAVACAAGPARAQGDPLRFVDDQTQVGTVDFRFTGTESLDPTQLPLQVATTQPGLFVRLRRRVGLGTGGAVFPFIPVEVAKDAVRLEQYYARNGFPRAAVDYDARLDSSKNRASVTFVIDEGPPLLVRAVDFVGAGRPDVADLLAPDLRDGWARFMRKPAVEPGDRLDDFSLTALQTGTAAWLRQRGYAFPNVGAERFVDSTGLSADIRIKVNPGPRARYDSITVEGAEGLAENVVLRELPFTTGDRFDGRDLKEGQSELFGLGLFQLALVEGVPDQPRDSTFNVRVRLRRGPTRIVSGFLGYFTDGGVTARGQATHRNFLGGARQLSLNTEARTGIGGQAGQAVSGGAITDYRVSLSLRQPYVFNRRFSATAQPSYRIRDDEIEQGTTAELLGSLLYTRSSLRTITAGLAGRYVDLSRGQGLRLLDPRRILNTDSLTSTTVAPSLDATWGRLDDELQPRRGIVARPSLLAAFGDVGFVRGRLALSALTPINKRVGVAFRLTGGRVATMGGSSPDDGRDYVLLRDRLFYSGGTADVRGWATNRLGYKAFVVTPDTAGFAATGQATLGGNGDVNYIGTGGRAKVSASAQLNLPFPLGPQWGSNVFVDAGQVFSPSTVPTTLLLRQSGNPADNQLADILDREGGIRIGMGAGIQYLTPIGFVSIALGFKVNPSYLDLRSAAEVYCGPDGVGDDGECTGGYVGARKAGTTFDETEIKPGKGFFGLIPQSGRFQFHLTIGQTF